MLAKLKCSSLMDQALGQATYTYYTEESARQFASLNVSQFLDYAEKCLEEEKSRQEWLYSEVKGRENNIASVQEILVKSHATDLIGGLPLLLEQASTKSMTQLYHLLRNVKELAPLRATFGQYIVSKGQNIVQEKEKDDTMIERLLEYKYVIDETVKVAFLNDGQFRQTQKESFEIFVNKRENKPAELIGEWKKRKLNNCLEADLLLGCVYSQVS